MKKKDIEVIKNKKSRIYFLLFCLLSFLENIDSIIPTFSIIISLCFTANFLPIAFPPTVSDDISELINSVVYTMLIPVFSDINIESIAPTEPLPIPQMSPITSLHILAI